MTDSSKRLIVIVLDRSGSMQSVKADTEGGLRAFLAEQENVPGETLVTLRQFDTEHETVFENVPLAEVPAFELRPRGGTALLDAVGSTIAKTSEQIEALPDGDRPGEVVLVILTDGQENSSVDWGLRQVKESISQRRAEGWVVYFLGADQDAITVASGMGIRADTSLSYDSAHTSDSMTSAGAAVARGSVSGLHGFTEDERTRAGGDDA